MDKIKKSVVVILSAGTAVFGLVSILAIWEIIDDKDFITKSLGTLGVLFVASLITLVVLKIIQSKGEIDPKI